jgi:aminoglycoside phosphotransferase (APT) family kinase protein
VSSVHQLNVIDVGGVLHRLVLKRWVGDERETATPMFDRETAVLTALNKSTLPTPRLIAASGGEETEGDPAILMTRLPGRVDLTPTGPAAWLAEMAKILAGIHSSAVDAPVSVPWGAEKIPPVTPSWSRRPELWKEAARILSGPAPAGACFIHGDYQHFNLLWSRGRVTGVIDWAEGGIGHPDRDIGHCQLNLAVLFSPEWARDFVVAYEAETGRTPDRWWNLYEICLYSEHWPRTIPIQVAGRAAVDINGMNGRAEDLLETVLGTVA